MYTEVAKQWNICVLFDSHIYSMIYLKYVCSIPYHMDDNSEFIYGI